MKSRVIPALFAVCVGSLGCGGQPQVPYSPLQKKTDLDPKKLYDAAEGTLLDRGFSIATRDESHFHLVTEPRTLLGSQISKGKYKYAFVVDTADGTLKIELKCQTESATSELQSCGAEAPEKLVTEQRQIADHAIAEAKSK